MTLTLEGLALALENAIIALGYIWAIFNLVPALPIRRFTAMAGRAFFLGCAMTHVHGLVHDLSRTDIEWHEHVIHAPQAVAIWCFLLWFKADVVALMDGRVAKSLRAR